MNISKKSKGFEKQLLRTLHKGLIVSCQPVENGPMDKTEHIVAMALAALAGGAQGLRIEGLDNVSAIAQRTSVPIIGIVKKDLDNSPVRISPFIEDIVALAEAGASIIAFDATESCRPVAREKLLNAIHAQGCIAMADCATFQEGKRMAECGCTFIATTMSGYSNSAIAPNEPDIALVQRFATSGLFVIAEGRYNSPNLAREAMKAGAWAVTVGSAITRIEHITSWFTDSIAQESKAMRGTSR